MTRLFRSLAAAAAIAISATAASGAASAQIMPNFDPSTLTTVLQSEGLAVEQVPGTIDLAARLPDGRVLVLQPNCTTERGCVGLSILAFIDEQADFGRLAEFNNRHVSVRASTTQSGRIVLNRYLIGDAGFVQQNFLINMLVMFNSVPAYFSLGQGPSQAVSLPLAGSTEAEAIHADNALRPFPGGEVEKRYLNHDGGGRFN